MRAALFLSLAIAALWLGAASPRRTHAGIPAPALSQPTYATTLAGALHIEGTGFGTADASRALRFDYEGQVESLDAASPLVAGWSETAIDLTLPSSVRPGTISVVVDGAVSPPAQLLVFLYSSQSIPPSPGVDAHPVTLDIDQQGRAWVAEEFHTQLKSVTAHPPAVTARSIPSDAEGIFAQSLSGDSRSTMSQLGEDIDVAADGSVWFTQGGGSRYGGAFPNTSRIVRFQPAEGAFTCYPVATDDAEVFGLALDDARGLVWYAESDPEHGNAITSFDPATARAGCDWKPGDPRPPSCPLRQFGCHIRHPLPMPASRPAQIVIAPDGDVWFTLFWRNAVARLVPATGAITEIPFPASTVRAGAGLWLGSGPWELAFDPSGSLWVTEFFDAAVSRVDAAGVGPACAALDADGRNPCVEEVLLASDGVDLRTLHSLAIDETAARVWFAVTGAAQTVGFLPLAGGPPVWLQGLPPGADAGGLALDGATGDLWFTRYDPPAVGHLQLAVGDGDGIPDATDNCPLAFNPAQENSDRDFVDLAPWQKPFNDLTWPASDASGDACDPDLDNDGLPNGDEESPATVCPSATRPTNPTLRDSDGDLSLDGAECMLGTDPADPASVPPAVPAGDEDRDGIPSAVETVLGTDPGDIDTDGDRLNDGVELRGYGSDPLVRNGDGDGCGDLSEAVSVNADRNVNSVDILLIALSMGGWSSSRYVPAFDVNRDRTLNIVDLAMTAGAYGPCRPA